MNILKKGWEIIKKRKLQDVDVTSCFESRFIKHIISFSEEINSIKVVDEPQYIIQHIPSEKYFLNDILKKG